jgi:hypothetical protein
MLMLVGPKFEAGSDELRRLAEVTGLVVYDLKTRLRVGAWSVLRALGEPHEVFDLVAELRNRGIPVVAVDPMIGFDVARRVVVVESLDLDEEELVLSVADQTMRIRYPALLVIVRGDVRARSARERRPSSGSGFSAVAPTAGEMQVFRERTLADYDDPQPVADLVFATVRWSARLDSRQLDFDALGVAGRNPGEKLDRLLDAISARAGVRVDRSFPHSSLASFAERPAPMRSRSSAPPPSSAAASSPRSTPVEHQPFDTYSRLIAEAERNLRGLPAPE